MESEFQRLIGYQFQDQGLMEEALEEAGPASAGNERLALLGDNILSIMLLRRWYREGDTTEQGTVLLQGYACNRQLTSRARDLDLQRFIHKRLDLDRSLPDHALATTVEAILGAVWLDSRESLGKVDNVMEKISLYPPEIWCMQTHDQLRR
jgi:ribonuclease-3